MPWPKPPISGVSARRAFRRSKGHAYDREAHHRVFPASSAGRRHGAGRGGAPGLRTGDPAALRRDSTRRGTAAGLHQREFRRLLGALQASHAEQRGGGPGLQGRRPADVSEYSTRRRPHPGLHERPFRRIPPGSAPASAIARPQPRFRKRGRAVRCWCAGRRRASVRVRCGRRRGGSRRSRRHRPGPA